MTGQLHPAVLALADKARAAHPGTLAVLAYGSALRDSSPEDTLVDLYLLTENFGGVSANFVSRLGCRLVPPNVYYLETATAGRVYRAKYAVLPLGRLEARCSSTTGNPYFWARFCQPCRLVWCLNDAAAQRVAGALQDAASTAFAHAKALAPEGTPQEKWERLFAETYRTEFRPEQKSRGQSIVAANLAHFEDLVRRHATVPPLAANWAMRRVTGKFLTVLRLIKASFTFSGGPDYLVWKIKRHSGVDIQLTDFQRRHPLVASITLLPMLLRKGAIR